MEADVPDPGKLDGEDAVEDFADGFPAAPGNLLVVARIGKPHFLEVPFVCDDWIEFPRAVSRGAGLPAGLNSPPGVGDGLGHADGGSWHVVGVKLLERIKLDPHLLLDPPQDRVGALAAQGFIGRDEFVPAPLGKNEEHRAFLRKRVVLLPEPRALDDNRAGEELGLPPC